MISLSISLYINIPISIKRTKKVYSKHAGDALCPRLCFAYISSPTNGPERGAPLGLENSQNQLTYNHTPSSGEILY